MFVVSYKKTRGSIRGAHFEHRRGVALLIVVLALLTFGIVLVAAGVFLVVSETKTAIAARASSEALSAAEAGAEEAIMRVRENLPIPDTIVVTVGNAQATVTTTVNGNQYTVVSDGVRGSLGRTVQVQFEKSSTLAQFFYGIQVGDGGLSMGESAKVNGNVFSNGSITGANKATITGTATVAGGLPANPQNQWTTENSNQFFATANGNEDIAQSFTATAGGAVPQVSVFLAKVGNPGNDITVRLHADNSDKPATSTLASSTIYRSTVGTTPSWIDVAFPSPANVTNNTKYWIVLDYQGHDSSNYWNWRKDNSDGYANNTGNYTSNCCSGNPSWTAVGGDLAFKVWIGGSTTRIEEVTIGDATSGDGYANLFDDTTIHGSACPNAYCHVENPARQNLPLSDGVIQDWRDAASQGGTCVQPQCDASGNYELDSNKGKPSGSLGPIKITGNLTVTNNATLTVTGTIWVVGTITLSNGCVIQLAPSYGSNSGVVLTDSTATVNPGCSFQGSGTAGSYPMLLSAKNDPLNTVVQIDNSSLGMLYYGAYGRLYFKQGATAKEATAYGITLENNATITYETGLANVNFSSGPSGGYSILSWREIAL